MLIYGKDDVVLIPGAKLECSFEVTEVATTVNLLQPSVCIAKSLSVLCTLLQRTKKRAGRELPSLWT